MTAPNRNTLWGEILVDELAACGLRAVCLAPGSRSTPLTIAFAAHPEIETFSHLDERSAAFFALGRARRTGRPTAVVSTSGTATANFHPAVMEANEGRVPLLVLTADRPPELHDSGANQTTAQNDLYGDAVRWHRTLPEPAPEPRRLRSLRVAIARAVATTTGTPPGPVHLNVPFKKPLEPTEVPGDVPADLETRAPEAVAGRDGPFVDVAAGTVEPATGTVETLVDRLPETTRGLIVAGPANGSMPSRDALTSFAHSTGFPVLADPLSGYRFGSHLQPPDESAPLVCGGYDSYLDDIDWPEPAVVIRFGASPTSKVLRKYLAGVEAHQYVIDPAGGWPEAEFTATNLVHAAGHSLVSAVTTRLSERGVEPERSAYRDRFATAEERYWNRIDRDATTFFEGAILHGVTEHCPDPATLFVSNSMPVRDLDRFGKPRAVDLTVLGNRGVSGIDGITSTALGAGSATDDPLVVVTGDIAYYHDMNGLLALDRCGVDATIVLLNNDGGGIFHKLPVAEFDPPFTEQFVTPHGLDFSPTADLYDLEFQRFEAVDPFVTAFQEAVGSDGTQVLCVDIDGEASHRTRESIHADVCDRI